MQEYGGAELKSMADKQRIESKFSIFDDIMDTKISSSAVNISKPGSLSLMEK